MITTIYFDMDDVLTDFSNYYHKIVGIDPKIITPEQWEDNWHKWVSSRHFTTIPMHPSANAIIKYVESTGVNIEILSSTGGPNFFDEICEQKTEWLHKHGIYYHPNYVPGKKFKRQFATPYRLLIDDLPDAVEDFYGAGGVGVVHRGDANETIATLMLLKESLGYQKYVGYIDSQW